MIKFYFHHTPNPLKVAMFLEETGITYELIPVDTYKGEQHSPEFTAINPNAKLPAIIDTDPGLGEGPQTVFDSSAILLYLADKTGQFLGGETHRGEMLSWLFFISSGLGPYSGQAVHFQRAAPEKLPYAINRYKREAERHYAILDQRITGRDWFVGDEMSIVDISTWGWLTRAEVVIGDDIWAKFPELARWFKVINARPSAEKVRELVAAAQFKRDLDEQAKRALYPQNY